MNKPIPQLRVRTEFSFRQAFGPLPRVAAALAELGNAPAGIVDGGTWGHVRWAKTAEKAGFKPLFGTELTIPQPDGKKPTAWFLATNTTQFYRFSTGIRAAGADLDALVRNSPGILRFAGSALTDPDTFDYVDMNPASPLAQRTAMQLAQRTGKPLVLTSDNYFPRRSDKTAFMAIIGQERVTPQHLLDEAELRAAIRGLDDEQFRRAVMNTHEAAERCASELPKAPIIHVPGDLRAMAEEGRQRRLRLGHLPDWPQDYAARLERELVAIEAKDFQSYFVVVSDLITWAKERMLVGPGRGSSAGSLLCYLLGITEVDPIPHGLLFERFVDLTRKDLPDIDIDFSDTKRDQCFTYLSDKYGSDCVARIGSINTLKPRSVMAEVCKRFGIPDKDRFDVLNVLIEYSSGDARYGKGLEDTLLNTDSGRAFALKHPKASIMAEVENHASHTGVHAAGVIVCNVPVSDYCTIGQDGVAQIDKPDSEYLNLLKIDALGLRTLGIIEDAGVTTSDELYALKLDDPEVLGIFNQRKFCGIFQFEGQSQRSISAQIHVESFKTVDHITALARPGPLGGGATGKYILRKAGREPVTTTHPVLSEMLSDTYGVVLYQEQVMRIVREIGKFSWEDTTVIRKAMSGRKGKEFFDQQGEKFFAGAAQDGIDRDKAAAIWNEICSFGAWGMNKCAHKDTRVKLAHPNQFLGPEPTIERLYEYYKAAPSKWIRQRKVMPVLLCVGDDGTARPTMAVDIHSNGKKHCVRLTFASGEVVECTEDHKFIINGKWQPCGDAELGDEFWGVVRDRDATSTSVIKNQGWTTGLHWTNGKPPELNGKTRSKDEFALANAGCPCEDCGAEGRARMEVHHNDLVSGNERPNDLAWLCNSCHKKRHIKNGTRRTPYARGHKPDTPRVLASVEAIGVHDTYDIEMPAPNHNYVLANGIITHNSHTCAYAVISYWCAWMKRYHPLQYAAASLRNAKDDDQTVAILREMADEGVQYVAFDKELSAVNWSVQDGKLVGGFMNLVGFGPSKAVAAVEARRLGKVPAAMMKRIDAAHVKFAELYPLQKEYADLYANPEEHGCRIGSKVLLTHEFPESGEVLFLARVTKKELRDENENVRVSRRGGRKLTGPVLFVDFMLKDDSGIPIIGRIDRFNFERFGRKAADNLVADQDVLLVRGKRIPNFPMVKIERMKCLNRPEALL